MATDSVDSVSAAKLAVYIILLQPALFCWWKHGKTGFLGWFYVQLFCLLRIVTGGIGLHGSQTGEAALILNSIGLSPLLLGISGVLHEARRAVNPRLNRKLDIILEIKYHGIVAVGMVLTIVAVVNLLGGGSASRDKVMLDVGSAISCVAWLLLTLWALWSASMMRQVATLMNVQTMPEGRTLLIGASVALIPTALRLAYGVTYLQLKISNPSSEFLQSKAVQVCLNVVPEMLCVISLLTAGILTRFLNDAMKKQNREGVREALSQDSEYK